MTRLTNAALVLVLVLVAATGCANASGQMRLGREPASSAGQIAGDQRLIDLKGEEGAVNALIGTGVSPLVARRRILDAQIARAGERTGGQ